MQDKFCFMLEQAIEGNDQAYSRAEELLSNEVGSVLLKAKTPLRPRDIAQTCHTHLVGSSKLAGLNYALFYTLMAKVIRGKAIQTPHKIQISHSSKESHRLLELDQVLTRLESVGQRPAQVMELQYFAGMGLTEIARVLGLTPATVQRDHEIAQVYLNREWLGKSTEAPADWHKNRK